jgi:type II secretory pathway pseudopilin PulG
MLKKIKNKKGYESIETIIAIAVIGMLMIGIGGSFFSHIIDRNEPMIEQTDNAPVILERGD